MKVLSLLLGLTTFTKADVYIQAGRGANCRLDEANRDRNNGNRMCDTQNNNRGGYNVGKLAYYVGETVPISWTNQHSSGDYQLKGAEFVLQYMCDVKARDGSSRTTIRDNPTQCVNFDCDRDVEYGRHESMEYYQYCKATSRNKGLFTSNQNLAGGRRSRRHTRQNPQGTRRGYECPEERDYYPWWGASPWIDIAIWTNQMDRCQAYRDESQNKKDRYECKFTKSYWNNVLKGYYTGTAGQLPITESECNDGPTYTDTVTGDLLSMWRWVRIPAHNRPKPECLLSKYTRTNHHGINGRTYWTYNWKVPNDVTPASEQCCVLRLRYNITTDDYPAWANDQTLQPGVDYRNNTKVNNPDPDEHPAEIDVWTKQGLYRADIIDSFNYAENVDGEKQGMSRGYVFRNNPRVDPHGDDLILDYDPANNKKKRIQLQLAINTNQFGRTFQDRTHCFQIKPLPNYIPSGSTIQLVSVQGKRGNIVQTYPATEYFFIPEPATITIGTYIHFCWTGSNTNPNNNDGQGKQGTDRSNICPLTQQQWDKTMYGEVDNNVLNRNSGTVGDLANNYPDYVDRPSMGFSMYYNYAHKRDVPRKSRTAVGKTPKLTGKHMNERISNVEPFNDPYNVFYFSEKGPRSSMAGLSQQILNILCTQRRIDMEFFRDFVNNNANGNGFANGNPFGLLDYGNMEELDDAGTTFCLEPKRAEVNGCWNFLSTRNNNFSNRSQKGKLCVIPGTSEMIIANRGGRTATNSVPGQTLVFVAPNAVVDGYTLEMQVYTWFQSDKESSIAEVRGPDGGSLNTNVLEEGSSVEVHISFTPKSLSKPVAYYRASSTQDWSKHSEASIQELQGTTYGVIQIKKEGYYTIQNQPNILAYIAFIIAVITMGTTLFCIFKKKCKSAE